MTPIAQTKFSKLSNLIFLTFTTFVISFVWLNNYISSLRLALISSIIISLFFFISYLVFKHYQNKIYTQKYNNKSQLEELKIYLSYCNNTEIIELIKSTYQFDNLKIISNYHYLDLDKNADIYLLFEKETLTNEDFTKIYKNRITNNLNVFCINYLPNYPKLENTTLEVFNLLDINEKLISNNIKLNNSAKLKIKPKLMAKDILCITLNRSKSRNYFLFGILILFSSIFTPYYIYYTVIGTLLLLLSLYSRFNNKFN